jgi:hypothetical protein
MQKENRGISLQLNVKYIVIIALVVISIVIVLRSQKRDVKTKGPVPPPSVEPTGDGTTKVDNSAAFALIDSFSLEATVRNDTAFSLFELELNQAMAMATVRMKDAVLKASEEGSGYFDCVQLIGCLAWDKVNSSDTASEKIISITKPFIDPVVKDLSNNIDTAIGNYKQALHKSGVNLAYELTSVGPSALELDGVTLEEIYSLNTDEALRNLGYQGATVSIVLGFDLYAVLNVKLIQRLYKSLASTAGKLFAREVAVVAASAAAALADGPLPVGDILAAAGFIWTAYDVWASRADFEEELKISLDNAMIDVQETAFQQAVSHVRQIMERHNTFQQNVTKEARMRVGK